MMAHRNSAWAVLAAIVLFAVGLLLVFVGSYLVVRGLGHGADSGGVREAMTGFGGLLLVVGVAHGYAAILISAHRTAGRSLGMVIAVIGGLLGLVVFVNSVRGLPSSLPGGSGLDPVMLIPLPYLLILLGLRVGRSHFRRVPGAQGDRNEVNTDPDPL